MGFTLTKRYDKTRENPGLTLDDVAEFIAEAQRVGIPGDTVLTNCFTTVHKSKLKQITAVAE